MGWPPRIGEPLPRAAECWCEPIKLVGWVLNPGGHGPEWERVFKVAVADRDRVWAARAASAADSLIMEVRDRGADGIVCGLRAKVTIGERSATVTTSRHYAGARFRPAPGLRLSRPLT